MSYRNEIDSRAVIVIVVIIVVVVVVVVIVAAIILVALSSVLEGNQVISGMSIDVGLILLANANDLVGQNPQYLFLEAAVVVVVI